MDELPKDIKEKIKAGDVPVVDDLTYAILFRNYKNILFFNRIKKNHVEVRLGR